MSARRWLVGGSLAAAGLVVLAGCAAPVTYDPGAAADLQQQVLQVTSAAAEGSYDTASVALLALEADARDAHARGLISSERLEAILAAATLVAASLESELAAERQAREQEEREAAEREAAEQAEREAGSGGGSGGGSGSSGGGSSGGGGNDDDGGPPEHAGNPGQGRGGGRGGN
ncbi:hypothetical protein [Microcella sp.]|uniref:hypothetical protein n=1 Tax=Microcella sp. TaxID=1913979 RepID=UPI003918A01F